MCIETSQWNRVEGGSSPNKKMRNSEPTIPKRNWLSYTVLTVTYWRFRSSSKRRRLEWVDPVFSEHLFRPDWRLSYSTVHLSYWYTSLFLRVGTVEIVVSLNLGYSPLSPVDSYRSRVCWVVVWLLRIHPGWQ